jgi:tRNA(Ile)-lysidine synthase TilS/MesJ
VADPPPANTSARFRAARHQLFREVVRAHNLQGVMLAHHADDQAETVLHRLLRGAHAPYVTGMSPETRVKGLLILRPLLHVPRADLRTYLVTAGQRWREDASNASPDYLRNRLRIILERHPALAPRLLEQHEALSGLKHWVREAAPRLEEEFATRRLHGWPAILAAEAGRRWLAARGVPPDDISPPTVARLVAMATDAATPARETFAGRVNVSRRNGRIQATV